MIALVEVGVRCRELGDSAIELVAPAEVGSDRDAVARASVRMRERPPARHRIEMAWCASSQLGWFGECRFRFFYGVLPRCSLYPLFDVERAARDVLGENTPDRIEIRFPSRVEALLAGEPPPPITASPLDPNWRVPDQPPDEWWQDLGDAPPSD